MAYIHQLWTFDIDNDFGTGAVTSIFWNFCPFHCDGCWNKDTWNRDESTFIENDELIKNVITALDAQNFHTDLALLGGDPFATPNIEDSLALIRAVRQLRPNVKIGVWSGYTWDQIQKSRALSLQREALEQIDYFIDGRFLEPLLVKNRRYGSWNQRIIDVQQSMKHNAIVLEPDYVEENSEHLNVKSIDDVIQFESWKIDPIKHLQTTL